MFPKMEGAQKRAGPLTELHMRLGLAQVNAASLRASVAPASGLELDLDEHELEAVGVDDVVLDAGLAGIGHA